MCEKRKKKKTFFHDYPNTRVDTTELDLKERNNGTFSLSKVESIGKIMAPVVQRWIALSVGQITIPVLKFNEYALDNDLSNG